MRARVSVEDGDPVASTPEFLALLDQAGEAVDAAIPVELEPRAYLGEAARRAI